MSKLLRFASSLSRKTCGLRIIFRGSKSGQPLLINVEFERVDRCDCHIDSEVELEAVEEQWIIDILRDYIRLLFVRYVINLVCHENATALRRGRWLYDPHFRTITFHLVL